MTDFETSRVGAYFAHLSSRFDQGQQCKSVCVAHMVPNTVQFLPAVDLLAPVALALPKPKSADSADRARLEKTLPTAAFHPLSRDWAGDPDAVLATFEEHGIVTDPLVVVDIGGYFATSIDAIAERYRGTILGVMEGTENGIRKYETAMPETVPVLTVGRSPLKLPEDYLIASSVIFSIEALLREQGQILQTRMACVIGYGRVGKGVASVLRGRGIPTVVHDRDPVAMAEAAAQGYQVFRRLDAALAASTLVIGATGNCSLDKSGFAAIRTGTVVATVTSGDDELNLDDLRLGYESSPVSPTITRYDEGGESSRYFWLLNDGNAANFLHGAVVGPAIQLIEGEKIAAISALRSGVPVTYDTPGEVDERARRLVAQIWNEHFLVD